MFCSNELFAGWSNACPHAVRSIAFIDHKGSLLKTFFGIFPNLIFPWTPDGYRTRTKSCQFFSEIMLKITQDATLIFSPSNFAHFRKKRGGANPTFIVANSN